MTEAEKALESLNNPDVRTVLTEGELLTIRKALQGVAKTRGLLKALKKMMKRASYARGVDYASYNDDMNEAQEAIAAFNSDETGVGL